MQDFDKKRIERMEQKLYSRKPNEAYVDIRSEIKGEAPAVGSVWKEEEGMNELLMRERIHREEKQNNFFKKLLIGAVAFFVLSIGVVLAVFFGGKNFVSANNIDIQVLGPTSTAGGSVLSLETILSNNNKADIESVTLLVEYPEGTRVAEDPTTPLVRERIPIGSIEAGKEVRKTLKSIFFGEKESVREVKLTLEYRVKGSSALFYKEKKYELAIKSTPVIVTVDYPKEVNANQEFEFVVEVSSNSGEVLHDLILKAEYPFGFTFKSAVPQAVLADSSWDVGDLPSGERKTIKIKGTLEGQNEEERTFHFSLGIASKDEEDLIGATLAVMAESVLIKKPFVGLVVSFDGDTGNNIVITPGQKVKANIVWSNNLSAKLLDMKIEARLTGASLDRNSVAAGQGGFYRSVDNTIVWDKSFNPDFSSVDPGESSAVSFTFAPISNISSSMREQDIKIVLSVSGNQLSPSGPPQSIFTTAERSVKISSVLGFSSRVVRSTGPFENMGPIPPRADMETTYTIIWNLTNSSNDLGSVRVEGVLPSYVKWQGLTSPQTENITYDTIQKKVIWNVGELRSGTGVTLNPREVAFHVALTPSLSQVGTSPVLMSSVKAVANDKFTGRLLEVFRPDLTTRATTDPGFKGDDDIVVK
jgi:hypothetical protein